MKINKKLMLIIVVCMLVMILFEAAVQIQGNIGSAERTTALLLEQVIKNAEKNDKADADLSESLKEEYIIRAKAVAYVIEHIPKIEDNIKELQKIADMMSVDEIHFFTTEGVIYGGTIPKYYGFSMDSGKQMAFFKPMLNDAKLALCQDLTPNTAESKPMMYAMVWRENQEGLVQVGIEPVRLLAELKKHEMSEYIASIPVVQGETIYVVDNATNTICAATSQEYIGKPLSSIGFSKDISEMMDKITMINTNEGRHICKFTEYNSYTIGVLYSLKVANEGMLATLMILFLYLLVASIIISFFVRRVDAMSKEKRALSLESSTDVLTGLLNKRAFYNESKEFVDCGIPKDFLMVSMDINGLKEVNDTHGHAAGDELIAGVAACIKRTFSNYGKFYRVGGDEFIGILRVSEENIDMLKREFDAKTLVWKGELIDKMSISCGYVTASEAEGLTYEEIEKLADTRMYTEKRKYYQEKGKTRDAR